MVIVPVKERTTTTSTHQTMEKCSNDKTRRNLRLPIAKQVVLLVFTAILLFGSFVLSHNLPSAQAANPGPGNACSWYRVQWGDTLTRIATRYHIRVSTLAHVNNIWNVNLIFVGQQLCIPHPVRGGSGNPGGSSGLLPNGVIRWYAYSALQWSNRDQVTSMLHEVAARYGLPSNLLLAIAWQESGWYQHVIARDGGIGVMQLMPYTAMGINAGTGVRRDPYHLWDNINLGATYLRWLWINFHGNLVKVISAYNEGGWAVIHRGIFNWRYVNNVLYLMWVFRNR